MDSLNKHSQQLIDAIRSTNPGISRERAIEIAGRVVEITSREISGNGEINFIKKINPSKKKQIVKLALKKKQ